MMTDRQTGGPAAGRPPVSVVVPFVGDRAAAAALLAALSRLRIRGDDRIAVVDNGGAGTVRAALREAGGTWDGAELEVVEAAAERSSYFARNAGAERTGGDWILFVDADCRPHPELLERYFEPAPGDAAGAIAGAVAPAADQPGLLARWAASRELLSQARALGREGPRAAATANLLVRRRAWEALGGFVEGIRSGGDYEFCWRLADAGWTLEHRPGAIVEHVHRETLGGVVRQMARYAAGNAWQERRRPGSSPRPRGFARAAAGAAGYAVTGRLERATMKAIDLVALGAQTAGRLGGNAARSERIDGAARVAAGRPPGPDAAPRRGSPAFYLEDRGSLDRARGLVRLALRHPLRFLRELGPGGGRGSEGVSLAGAAALAADLERAGTRRVIAGDVDSSALAARVGRLTGLAVEAP